MIQQGALQFRKWSVTSKSCMCTIICIYHPLDSATNRVLDAMFLDEFMVCKLLISVKDFISDHATIICHLRCPKPSAESKQFSYRRIKDIDVPAFKNDIENSDIVQNPAADLTGLVTQYNEILTEIPDKHAPLKTCNLRLRVSQPWYDKNVRTTKHKLRNAECKWRKSKCPDDCVFLHYKNKLHENIKEC